MVIWFQIFINFGLRMFPCPRRQNVSIPPDPNMSQGHVPRGRIFQYPQIVYYSGTNSSTSNFSNLTISNLSTSDFKFAKSSFLANCDVSTSPAFF